MYKQLILVAICAYLVKNSQYWFYWKIGNFDATDATKEEGFYGTLKQLSLNERLIVTYYPKNGQVRVSVNKCGRFLFSCSAFFQTAFFNIRKIL